MNPAKYSKRVEIWRNEKVENELKEKTTEPVKVKTIWMQAIPQTGKLQKGEGDTKFSKVDMKFKCRYASGHIIKEDFWLVYKETHFDIEYILNPGFANVELEIFTSSIRE